MKATIAAVFPNARAWGEKYPDKCSVTVRFQDGSLGEYGTTTAKADEIIKAFQTIVGQEYDFEINEEKTRDYQGVTTYALKSYPGKPDKQFGGGGGKQYVPSFHQTEAGCRYEQLKMDRRTALMQAVQFAGASVVQKDVLMQYADEFYKWLRADDEKPPGTANPPRTDAAQSNGNKWMGPGNCPSCGATPKFPHKEGCAA